MSLYNLVFGRNPIAPSLLAMLDLTEGQCGRFRDVFLQLGESGDPEIHVYTRNGGGNREDYQHVFDELSEHPLYLGDADDDYNCTYATIRFRAPEAMRDWLRDMAKEEDKRSPGERWQEFIDRLKTKPDDADVKRVTAAMEPLMRALSNAVKGEP